MVIRKKQGRAVYVVDGLRTPFLKVEGKPGDFSASDLAVNVGKTLLSRQPFSPEDIDEVIIGSAMPSPDEANIARIIALRLGCGDKVPAWTVMRNCASGMQALDDAYKDISYGRCDLVLAGGTDAMSRAPLLYNDATVNWFAEWMGVRRNDPKKISKRLKLTGQLLKNQFAYKKGFLQPIIALLRGLSDPIVGLNMGQTAEKLAFEFGITRQLMDVYSQKSHLRAAKAWEEKCFDEVVPLYSKNGSIYMMDTGIRPDSNLEKLAKLKPYFDKKYGNVTPGNSSQITDGASVLLLASENAVKLHNLSVLGRLVDIEWAALDPSVMGLGPVHAMIPLLKRNRYHTNDIDFWEINEAFAAQVLGCLYAWQDNAYCRKHFKMRSAFEAIDPESLNVDGGAIALGHPIGASGARIVLHLLNVLKRNGGRRGVASICIGGGQGGAVLLEG